MTNPAAYIARGRTIAGTISLVIAGFGLLAIVLNASDMEADDAITTGWVLLFLFGALGWVLLGSAHAARKRYAAEHPVTAPDA